jgi:hypothetical protein
MDASGLAARIPIPIRLAWLAGLDEPVEGALADVVGDSYLCMHSGLYASVRRAALAVGFRFSCADSPLWRDYHFLPLTTIDRLLADRVIPYSDTWGPLRRMIEANPKAAMPIHLLIRDLAHNHTMHESAHGLAHVVLQDLKAELRAVSRSPEQAEVLKAILGECFANTVEMTCMDFDHNLLVDEICYAVNSYMAPSDKNAVLLKLASEKWGARGRFRAFLAAYFESNLTAGEQSPEAIGRVAETCGLDRCEALDRIMEVAFNLNRRFREDTTPFYFERRGLSAAFREVLACNWLGGEDRRAFVRLFMERVWLTIQPATTP